MAALALVFVAALDAVAETPQPGTVISKDNMDKYKEVLFPTAEYFLRNGMTITVAPYRKYEWPPKYKEATEKYASQVKISADGRDMENYVAGAPFPNIDSVNDPLAGYKWMWNFEQKPGYTDNVGCGWNVELVNSKGERERFLGSNFWRRMMWRGRLVMDPKPVVGHDPAIGYTEQWGPLHDPNDLKGAGVLNFRYTSADVPDDSYMYLPELRKVRRLSIANRSDAFWGTDIDIDSIWTFNAKIPYWTFKVIAEKKLLQPFHSGGYGQREAWCAQPDGTSGIKSFAFCVPWELRDVVVVEGQPTGYSQYGYSKKIVYLDKEGLTAGFSEMYDHGGQIWKAWYMMADVGKTPQSAATGKPTYEYDQMFYDHGGVVDFQLNHTSKWDCPDGYLYPNLGVKHWYFNEPKEWNTPDTFSVNYLIKSAGF
jgi:hypothetical protein